jgi:hypothetical protein
VVTTRLQGLFESLSDTYIVCRLPYIYTPRSLKVEGGILFYLCPSFRPSKIFFFAFFSVTVDGRNLIFGHKRHIDIPIVGSVFGPVKFLLPVCRLSWFLYTLNIYAHFSSHFSQQLLMTGIWYLVTSFI